MAPRSSGSSSLDTLSQALPLAPSCLSALAPTDQTPPPAPSASFLSVVYTSSVAPIPPHKLSLFAESLPTPFSSELVRTCPYIMKPSEDPEVKSLISHIP